MSRNQRMSQLRRVQSPARGFFSVVCGLSAFGLGAGGPIGCSPAATRKPLSTAGQTKGQYSNLSLQFVVRPASAAEEKPEKKAVGLLLTGSDSQRPPAQLKYCIDVKGRTSDSAEIYNCNFFELIQSGQKFQIQEKVWNSSGDALKAGSGFPAQCFFEPVGQTTQFRCSYTAGGKLFPCTSYPDELTLADPAASGDEASGPTALLAIATAGTAGGFTLSGLDFADKKNAKGSTFPTITEANISPSEGHKGSGEHSALTGCAALFNPAIEGHELVSGDGKVLKEGDSEPPSTSGQKGSSQWTFIYSGSGRTALKNSQAQSTSLDEDAEKCTIDGGDGSATITVQATPNSDAPGTSSDNAHHTTGPVLSAKQGGKDICAGYINKNPSGTTYLFKEHWTLK